jgi:hypothetical protein
MFKHPHSDIQSERLLLVSLEEPSFHNSEYRHIRATVVRRAVPHKYRADAPAICDGTGVETWNDDHITKCSGYRVASYVFSKTSATYVDDMQLRGQLDVMPRPMRNGRPYGNKVIFKPYDVDQNTARAISDFYTKYGKFFDKNNLRRQDDDFYVALHYLAVFLKITKVVFFKPGVRHASLSEANRFEEMDLVQAKVRIDELLAPFYVKSEAE